MGVARSFKALFNINPGDRIGLYGPNCAEIVIVTTAAHIQSWVSVALYDAVCNTYMLMFNLFILI